MENNPFKRNDISSLDSTLLAVSRTEKFEWESKYICLFIIVILSLISEIFIFVKLSIM